MPREKPLLHAVVMCDYVHLDPGTGKWSLLGTFTNVNVRTGFPAQHGPVGIFISVSHWTSDLDLILQIVRESTQLIGRLPPIRVPKQEPGRTLVFGLNLPPIPLPAPGRYAIQVLAGDEIFHEFAFAVIDKSAPQNPSQGQKEEPA